MTKHTLLATIGTSPQIGRSKGQHDGLKAAPDIKIVESQAADWGQSREYLPEYLRRLDALVDDGLPKFESPQVLR